MARATPVQLLTEAIQGHGAAIAFGLDPNGFDAQRLVIVRGRHALGPGQALVGDQFAKQAHVEPGATLLVKRRPFRVAGVFHSGTTFQDSGVVIPLAAAQRLSGHAGAATTIAVALDRGAIPGPRPGGSNSSSRERW